MLNAIALYDCVADEEGELSFTEGTRFVDVVDSSEEDWLEGRIEGTSQRGLFPSNYVNVITVSSTPSVVKQIPKTSNPDANLSHSVSPPNSNISSSWSVIPNTPTNSTPTTDIIIIGNNNNNNNNNSSSNNLPNSKTTKLDAFDSAIQTPPSSKYSDIATTLMNKRTMPKPTIASSSPITTTTTTSNSIAATMDASKSPSPSRAFVLPVFSPAQQQTRARSFSASSTTSPAPPTAMKPSALRQDFRRKAQLDTSWRTKLENGSSSPTTNTNSSQRPSLNRVTDNKASITSTTGNDDEDIEEEDGYQLIKPSQLRKRQQQQGKDSGKLSTMTTTAANLSLSSSVSTSAIPTQKASTSTKIRLQTLPSSSTTHLAKLPSRPVSNANRQSKSRSSSTRSNSLPQSNNNISSVTSDNSITATTTTGISKNAPTVKPKPPQLNNLPKTSIMTTKERSASNPPAIQPKTFANDIHRPSKPAVDSKPLFPLPTTTSHTENNAMATKTIPLVGARGGVALPGLGKKNSAPTLPTRPSATVTTSTQPLSGSAIDDILKDKKHIDENSNLKPSQLLTTQRARSSTNPSFTTRPLVDVTNGNGYGSRKLASTTLLDTPIDGAIRSPPPPPPPATTTTTTKSSTLSSSASPTIPLVVKQAPPPPPPSRQINHSNNNNNSNKKESSSGRTTRYDELFNTIQDDGYVDGLTAQVIWSKSRLSDDTLAGIWQQCDQQKSGLLDRQRFITGMRQIDSHLAKNRTPVTS